MIGGPITAHETVCQLLLQQQQNLRRRFGTNKMHLNPLVA